MRVVRNRGWHQPITTMINAHPRQIYRSGEEIHLSVNSPDGASTDVLILSVAEVIAMAYFLKKEEVQAALSVLEEKERQRDQRRRLKQVQPVVNPPNPLIPLEGGRKHSCTTPGGPPCWCEQ